jgi:hypothetical protein
MQSDIRVVEIQTYKVPVCCRTPLKFGAVVVEELPIDYVRAVVENRRGARAEGWIDLFMATKDELQRLNQALCAPYAERGDALLGRADLRQPGGPRHPRRLWQGQRHRCLPGAWAGSHGA